MDSMTPEQKLAIEALLSERAYHKYNSEKKGWEHEDVPTVADELVLLHRYLLLAYAAFTDNAGSSAAMEIIRKLGGMCMRAMENHGASMRVIPKDE